MIWGIMCGFNVTQQGSYCVWEMTLHCNVVSHWLGACTKRSLLRTFYCEYKLMAFNRYANACAYVLCDLTWLCENKRKKHASQREKIHIKLTKVEMCWWANILLWCFRVKSLNVGATSAAVAGEVGWAIFGSETQHMAAAMFWLLVNTTRSHLTPRQQRGQSTIKKTII